MQTPGPNSPCNFAYIWNVCWMCENVFSCSWPFSLSALGSLIRDVWQILDLLPVPQRINIICTVFVCVCVRKEMGKEIVPEKENEEEKLVWWWNFIIDWLFFCNYRWQWTSRISTQMIHSMSFSREILRGLYLILQHLLTGCTPKTFVGFSERSRLSVHFS